MADDDPTRALLLQLLGRQDELLREVRDSKDQISALTQRIDSLEASNRDGRSARASVDVEGARQEYQEELGRRPQGAPSERRSVSTSASTLYASDRSPQKANGLARNAEKAPSSTNTSNPTKRKRTPAGDDTPSHGLATPAPESPTVDAPEREAQTAAARTPVHVAISEQLPSPPEPEPFNRPAWSLDDAVVVPKDAPVKTKKRKLGQRVQTPIIIVPHDPARQRRMSMARWIQSREQSEVHGLLDNDIEIPEYDTPPTVQNVGSKFSIRSVLHGTPSPSVEKKPKLTVNTTRAASTSTGERKKKRARRVPEVFISIDGSMRQEMALARSVHDVLTLPAADVQSASEETKGDPPQDDVKIDMPVDDKKDFEPAKVLTRTVFELFDDDDVEVVPKTHTTPSAVLAPLPDYDDLFGGDLSDLTDSEDEDESEIQELLRPSAPSSPTLSAQQNPVAGPSRQYTLKIDATKIASDLGLKMFSEDGVQRRLASFEALDVDLDPEIRNATVSREFMSTTYGGSARQFYPTIASEKRALLAHDHHFLFPNLARNPHAPRRPGALGLLCRSSDDAPWGRRAMKVLVCIKQGVWWYVGDYETVRSDPLSAEEFRALSRQVKMGWEKAVRKRKKKHDVEIRARIILRRTLGREPTAEDMAQAFEIDRNFADVTENEIIEAYNGGKERIYIWCFKCVAYDAAFQSELAEKFEVFVPAPRKQKVAATQSA